MALRYFGRGGDHGKLRDLDLALGIDLKVISSHTGAEGSEKVAGPPRSATSRHSNCSGTFDQMKPQLLNYIKNTIFSHQEHTLASLPRHISRIFGIKALEHPFNCGQFELTLGCHSMHQLRRQVIGKNPNYGLRTSFHSRSTGARSFVTSRSKFIADRKLVQPDGDSPGKVGNSFNSNSVHAKDSREKFTPLEKALSISKTTTALDAAAVSVKPSDYQRWTAEEDAMIKCHWKEDNPTAIRLLVAKINQHNKRLGYGFERSAREMRNRYNKIKCNTGPAVSHRQCSFRLETHYEKESERMREIVEEVLRDKTLGKDLEETHAPWPSAIDRMILRGKEENISGNIITAHLPGKTRLVRGVMARWYYFLKAAPTRQRARWTEQEEEYVKKHISAGKSYQWIADHKPSPARTAMAIQRHDQQVFKNHTTTVKRTHRHRRYWTAEEDSILKQGRAMGMSFKKISENLPGRSAHGVEIRWKLHLLGPATSSVVCHTDLDRVNKASS